MTLTSEEILNALKKALDELVWEREEYGERIVSLDYAYTQGIEKISAILGIEPPPY